MAQVPMEIRSVECDVVVFGGGGAASRAALSARLGGARVHQAAKAPLLAGGSTVHGASEIMSMGAAGFGDAADGPDVHYRDTMRAGRGFIDPVLVRALADEAPRRIEDLIAYGVEFDRVGDGLKLIKSDFGSFARALGAGGRTGRVFVEALNQKIVESGVEVDVPVALIDLVRDEAGEIAGAVGYDTARHMLIHYRAPCVVLGTGGMHGAFTQQVSTAEMTGDGQAICFRHGAEMVNLEFHQFGPALIKPYVQLFSGSCFELHPKLLNVQKEEFLSRYVPQDVDINEVYGKKVFTFTTSNVSRYIDISMAREVAAGRGTANGGIYFSFAGIPLDQIRCVMPNTTRWMGENGIDLETDLLEVGIAFQCMNGGVRMVDADAQSSIAGLFVAGEVAGGIRGPDRPGGNSLAEGQVFGHRAGSAAARRALGRKSGAPETLAKTLDDIAAILGRPATLAIKDEARRVQEAMQRHCLVEKSEAGLTSALADVEAVRDRLETGLSADPDTLVQGLGVRNLVQGSELVLRACLLRKETRSAHYRTDYPATDDSQYLKSFIAVNDGAGGVTFRPHHYAQDLTSLEQAG